MNIEEKAVEQHRIGVGKIWHQRGW